MLRQTPSDLEQPKTSLLITTSHLPPPPPCTELLSETRRALVLWPRPQRWVFYPFFVPIHNVLNGSTAHFSEHYPRRSTLVRYSQAWYVLFLKGSTTFSSLTLQFFIPSPVVSGILPTSLQPLPRSPPSSSPASLGQLSVAMSRKLAVY